jgi:hypothetical protein
MSKGQQIIPHIVEARLEMQVLYTVVINSASAWVLTHAGLAMKQQIFCQQHYHKNPFFPVVLEAQIITTSCGSVSHHTYE